jgi:ArsR family transcriptional regulator
MTMPLISIYECLCDETRLRIIHLVTHGPLCVCQLQKALDVPQSRISQHLAYLRDRQMVGCQRHGTWMIYSLPDPPPPALANHLACLQDYALTSRRFQTDLQTLRCRAMACAPKPKPKQKLQSAVPS